MVPGLARQMLADLAPLLAEEGIDVDNLDATDLDTLQQAMNRAVERRNLELFSPVGPARDIAAITLRLVVRAVLDNDTALASPSRRTTRSPPSPAASVSPWACSTSGCPDSTTALPPGSPSGPGCPPDTGTANAPPPTSSPWPARARPSAPWTSCTPAKAAFNSSPGPPSPSQPPPGPGHNSPTRHRPS
jgi:hypothetical protein